jgi:inorganic triphosphatase YgiF
MSVTDTMVRLLSAPWQSSTGDPVAATPFPGLRTEVIRDLASSYPEILNTEMRQLLQVGTRLPNGIHKEDLRPVFTSAVTRKMIELDPTPTTKIAVAIDQGEIRTADSSAVEPISEIALELKRGEPAVLYDLALQLLKNAAIRIETRSKVERGYRLLRGAVDGPLGRHRAGCTSCLA